MGVDDVEPGAGKPGDFDRNLNALISQLIRYYPRISGIDTNVMACFRECQRQIACNILHAAASRQF